MSAHDVFFVQSLFDLVCRKGQIIAIKHWDVSRQDPDRDLVKFDRPSFGNYDSTANSWRIAINFMPIPLPSFIYGTAWKKDATAPLVRAAVNAGFKARAPPRSRHLGSVARREDRPRAPPPHAHDRAARGRARVRGARLGPLCEEPRGHRGADHAPSHGSQAHDGARGGALRGHARAGDRALRANRPAARDARH